MTVISSRASVSFLGNAFALLLLVASPVAMASSDTPLVIGPAASVTGADIDAETLRVPALPRKATLSRPESVSQIASNLYARRTLALEAEKAGLDKSPEVIAALKLARERVLAEARLAKVDDANRPNDQALDALAQATYRANEKRFEAPAQTRARHILIRNDVPEARKKAEDLLAQLKAGADFAALAKTHSGDPGSAANGGDLGFFPAGRMVKPFEDALAALKQTGELSDVVQSPFGFHIIKLEGRRPAGVRPYAEVSEELKYELLNQTLNEARNKELQRIMSDVKADQAAIEAYAKSQR